MEIDLATLKYENVTVQFFRTNVVEWKERCTRDVYVRNDDVHRQQNQDLKKSAENRLLLQLYGNKD